MLLSVAGNDENTCCECNGASELEEPDDDRPREPNPKRTIVIAVAVIVAVVVVVAVAVVWAFGHLLGEIVEFCYKSRHFRELVLLANTLCYEYVLIADSLFLE